MAERSNTGTSSLSSALTSPITKTFAERKSLGMPRGLSLDIIPDFMMPVQNDQRIRRASDSVNRTMEIERNNLLGLTQLIIKDLIETSMPLDRTVSGQFQPLQHLFSVLEQMLKHGIRPKKAGLLASRTRDVWNVLESLESVCQQSKEVTESCRNLSHIETNIGKVRAWIRLSLMQKKLPDYFKALVDHRDSLLAEWYDPNALLMNDESSVVAGLLVGLNFIDYNLCVKDEDLDREYQIISLLPYLKIRSQPEQEHPPTDWPESDSGSETLFGGTKLKSQMANLEAKVESLTSSNMKMSTELDDTKKLINTAQLENQDLQLVNERMRKNTQEDLTSERDAFHISRQSLDTMNTSLQTKFEREVALKQDMERELKLQTNIRSETEAAMKLMEREIQEKGDLVLLLRKQLDDLKLVNLEMYQKLQIAENALKHKSDLVARMEEKMKQMGETMMQLGGKIHILENERRVIEETARKLSMQLAETDMTRSALESDLRLEQEQKASLLGSLTEQEDKLKHLQGEVESIRTISESYEKLRDEHENLQKMSVEQEEALTELGTHLSEQKVKVTEIQELANQLDPTAQQWEKDATICKLCEKPFTVARRKHHCRHCGGTFCNPCSDNKMPLPSSPKPVRVCDNCHILLLRRFSTAK